MRIRIVCKLADCVDGIDLSHCAVGDAIDLAERQARIMVAEQWAVFARRAADKIDSAGAAETLALSEGRRLNGDRRHSARLNDVYQRLRDKREQMDEERRRLRRRTVDAGEPTTTYAA